MDTKIQRLYYKGARFILFVLLITEINSINIHAQTFPPNSSCTSKDLELVGASLPGTNPCNTCTPGTSLTRTLYVSINNKTGSTRTAFAFWGYLEVYNDDGTLDAAKSGPRSGCVGPVPKNTTTNFPTGVSVTYECGQSLRLTNLHLAWTDASPSSTCATLLGSPSTINPKCGTLPLIQINAGVNANVTISNATCSSNGSITVSPFGGKSPYTIAIGATSYSNITTSATFSNLASNTYTITITDANGCTITKSKTVGPPSSMPQAPASGGNQIQCAQNPIQTLTATATSSGTVVWYDLPSGGSVVSSPTLSSIGSVTYYAEAVSGSCTSATRTPVSLTILTNPSAPSVCVVEPSLCGPATGSITILSPTGVNFQYSVTNGSQWQLSPSFTGLAAGSVSGILVKNAGGCISTSAGCTPSNCPTPIIPGSTPGEKGLSTERVVKAIINDDDTRGASVSVFPNPFTDKVKFLVTTPVSGNGELAIFNVMGQKVKSIYQGYFTSGVTNFEVNIPDQQSNYFIYKLVVGDNISTGKLFKTDK